MMERFGRRKYLKIPILDVMTVLKLTAPRIGIVEGNLAEECKECGAPALPGSPVTILHNANCPGVKRAIDVLEIVMKAAHKK